MTKTPYEAGGFAFPNEEMMEQAEKEIKGISYIKNSADMDNPQIAFGIYCQMARQGIFETPAGYAYLHSLRESLKAEPSIDSRQLPPIPVSGSLTEAQGADRASKPQRVRTKTKIIREKRVQNINYKPWFQASVTVSLILLLIVIGMFAVAATSGNVNILNYKNQIIEEYENWDAQLKEKEQKLKEKEKELNEREDALRQAG